MTFLTRVRVTIVGTASLLLIVASMAMLAVASGHAALAVAFVVAYGCGNGIFTIVRGTTPAEIYGSRGLGELLGHLSRPSQYARALAPGTYSLLLALGLTQSLALGALVALLGAGLGCYLAATRERPKAS